MAAESKLSHKQQYVAGIVFTLYESVWAPSWRHMPHLQWELPQGSFDFSSCVMCFVTMMQDAVMKLEEFEEECVPVYWCNNIVIPTAYHVITVCGSDDWGLVGWVRLLWSHYKTGSICFCVCCSTGKLPKLNLISRQLRMTKSGTNMKWAAVCVLYLLCGFCLRLSSHSNIERVNLSSRCRLNPTVQTRFSAYSSQIRAWAAPLPRLSAWSRKSLIVFLLYYTCGHYRRGWGEGLMCLHRGAICCHSAITEKHL